MSNSAMQDLENSARVKDKHIMLTDSLGILAAAQSPAQQPSGFAQTPVSVTAATENCVAAMKHLPQVRSADLAWEKDKQQ